MEYKALKEIAKITMGQSPDSSSYNDGGDGLPFFQGNADFGELYPNERVWCNAPKKIAEPGDILISVRAPIGALNYAKDKCCIGRGLAAITVEDDAERAYVFHLLKAQNRDLNKQGTGSTFKAIGKTVLEEVQVPQISLEEQRKCMALMDLLESIIRERKAQIGMLDNLIKARFVEMFGDPVSNPFGLQIKKLSELGSLDRGKSQHRPRNAPELLNGPYPLIQTGEVSAAGLYITEYHSTYSELGLKQSRMWKAGTLCITIAANIAQTAIMTFDACFPDSVVGFVPYDEVSALYIHYWFGFFQKILEEQAPQVAQKNINLKILSDLNVIVPGKKMLNQFETFVAQVDKSKVVVQKALDEAQLLFDGLMQRYFG